MLFCRLLIFFSQNITKNTSRNTIRVATSLDPGQARRFGGPDLGPKCLQRLSADDTSRQSVNKEFRSESNDLSAELKSQCGQVEPNCPAHLHCNIHSSPEYFNIYGQANLFTVLK